MNEKDDLDNLIFPPSIDHSKEGETSDLISGAIDSAKAQTQMRDVLSLTIGNIFAFFSFFFLPVVTKLLNVKINNSKINKQL